MCNTTHDVMMISHDFHAPGHVGMRMDENGMT